MSKKNKILLTIIMLLGVTSLFTENQSIGSVSVVAMFILIITMKLTDYLIRKRLIKQIKNKNMTCIKVKESNKVMILYVVLLIFNSLIGVKSIFNINNIQSYDNITDIISYINSFDYSHKLLIFAYIMLFILAILTVAQVLFSSSIITYDKVIFYDDLVFEINQIEEIKYKEPLILKNKKIITLGKGFTDRNIVVKIEDFDKVKSLLEGKMLSNKK